MTVDRHLLWDGCFNVRDLGGHVTADGRETRWGAVVRSDSPARLTEAGWAALQAHGVRTMVDLRDPQERASEPVDADVTVVSVPVLDFGDTAFWERWRGVQDSRRFYREALEHWPRKFAAAASAVARAEPGGVLVHCAVGRDRTGLLCALLLAVVGVPAEQIAADYALSADRLRPLYDILLEEAEDDAARERLHGDNESDPLTMLDVLAAVDARSYLLDGGTSEDELALIQARLLG